MYRRILAPTDGSEAAMAAVERAIDLAATYDAELHTLFAVHAGYLVDGSIAGVTETLEALGEDAVAEVTDRAEAAGIEAVVRSVVHGTPHQVILDYAADHDIDLIVLGTHGRTGLDRYLLGSTTERVVRLSDVPVLTVRTHREA